MHKTTAPGSSAEDFVQQHLPRHEPIEAMRTLIANPQEDIGKSFLEYVGTFTATANTTKERVDNLLDLYEVDPRQIYQDAHQRQEHYDERQNEILDHLVMGRPLTRAVTDQEKNELLLTFLRRSVPDEERERRAREQDRRRRQQEQEDDDDTVMEDGRTLSEVIDSEKAQKGYEGTFEAQDIGDKIIV